MVDVFGIRQFGKDEIFADNEGLGTVRYGGDRTIGAPFGQPEGPTFVRRVGLVRYLLPGPQIDEFDGAGEVSPCGIVGLEGAAHHDCAREVDVFGMGEDGHGEFESGESHLEIRGAVAALRGLRCSDRRGALRRRQPALLHRAGRPPRNGGCTRRAAADSCRPFRA